MYKISKTFKEITKWLYIPVMLVLFYLAIIGKLNLPEFIVCIGIVRIERVLENINEKLGNVQDK